MILKRVAYTDQGTFGVLIEDGTPFAVTLELPWRDNETNISCIPVGKYMCETYTRNNGDLAWEVTNVPGRYAILFHIANTVDDLKGCIGVAEEYGILHGVPAVLSSGRGYKEFLHKMHTRRSFILDIQGETDEL